RRALCVMVCALARPPGAPLFPYTTLFRSPAERARQLGLAGRWNAAAERYGGEWLPRAVREQRAELAALGGGSDESRLEADRTPRSEEHTSELQSPYDLVCRLLLEKKKTQN